jgi:DNA-binding IclR family transcriptional regulator
MIDGAPWSPIIESDGPPKRTENTVTDPARFREELARTTERGYSIENEERRIGVSSVGVPITDGENELIGAMSVSGPANRFLRDWIETEALPILNDAVNVTELRYVHD